MEKVYEFLKLLKEKHPSCMWIFARFLFAVFGINLLIHIFVLAMIGLAPFIVLMIGKGFVGFLAWYFAPSIAFITGVLYKLTMFVYDEYVVEENVYDGTD